MRSRSPFMVYTAAPPDYCDNDVEIIVQYALSGVNSFEKERLNSTSGKWHLHSRYCANILSG